MGLVGTGSSTNVRLSPSSTNNEVEVDVQVDQATEPLVAVFGCRGERDAALPRGDRAHDETADPGRPHQIAREPQAQRLGYG